jgi:hypothetical protein
VTTKKPTTQGNSVIPDKAAKDTLDSYTSVAYGKELFLAEAKVGKTIFLFGSLLGVMPWQEFGGVVDDPRNLHVITFDANALGGAKKFLVEKCGASEEIGKAHVINLQDHTKRAFASDTEYDPKFLTAVYDAIHNVQDRASKGGVHALLFSSLTMCAKAIVRSISGPAFGKITAAGQMKASPMDQNKWGLFAQQMTELQFATQVDSYHTIWEAHHGEKQDKKKKDSSGEALVYDSIQVQGSTAQTFPAQVERPYILNRTKGGWKPGSDVDMVTVDTRPNLDFGDSIMSGRQVVGALDAKETDLTAMFSKLGLAVGQWGAE